jgi:hypothetical protein
MIDQINKMRLNVSFKMLFKSHLNNNKEIKYFIQNVFYIMAEQKTACDKIFH